jgi:hypothetical protein
MRNANQEVKGILNAGTCHAAQLAFTVIDHCRCHDGFWHHPWGWPQTL